jgi:threonyl-tRNA synthetase
MQKRESDKISSFLLKSDVVYRMKLFDELKEKQNQQFKGTVNSKIIMSNVVEKEKPILVNLPNGSRVPAVSFRMSPFDIALKLPKAEQVVAAKVNGVLWDLNRVLESDCSVEFVNFDSEEGKKVFWSSSAQILGHALEIFSECQLCSGMSSEEGFYYEAKMER